MQNKSKEQVQILILSIIFIITGYFVFFMYFLTPQLSKSKDYDNKIADLRRKVRKIEMNLRNKDKIEKEIKEIKRKIEEFEIRMPRGDESWSIEQLDQLAKSHNVITKNIAPESISEKDNFFRKNLNYDLRQINVIVLCSYNTFGAFINALETSSPFVKVKFISIKKGNPPDYLHKINFKIMYLVLKKKE